MRAGVVGVRLHRPHERIARVRKALQLDQHETHAIPGQRAVGRVGQHLAERLERELEAPRVE